MSASRVAERRAAYALQTAVEPALGASFDLLVTAPQGVAKLRELILSLAVRGRLATHDPCDESADVLFEKIQQEKSELMASGELRRGRLRAQVEEAAKPFELPANWRWTRLGDAASKITDGTHHSPPNTAQGDFKYISAKNIKSWGIDLSNVTYVTRSVHEEIYARCDPVLGDVLYIKDGATTGVVTINSLTEPFSMLSSVALIKPSCGLTSEFLIRVMASPFFYSEMRAGMTGVAITRVTLGKLEDAWIPLPPLAEQTRIVARVEELMQLCDALEAHGRLQDEQHARLVSTLFDTLAASESAEALAENWQRIATHFDLLLDRPEAADTLEQTLLQLAVRGLLVPQDPTDEPASELLDRIRAEKDRLIVSGQIKRDKPLPSVGDDEKQFEVPRGWMWARINHVSESRLGKMLDKSKNAGKPYPYLRNTNVQWHRIELDDIKEIRLDDHEVAEYRLADGDLLICEGGYPGRCAIWDKTGIEMFFQKALHRVRPLCGVMAKYLEICLRTDSDSGALEKYFTGATIKHFAGQELNRYAIPLPPLAEQHRIVARVEQLRGLCADLRERLQQSRATQSRLADALAARTGT